MSKFQIEDCEDDDYYLTRMKDILEETYQTPSLPRHPSKLLGHVYIGNQDNADDLDLLQALEVTHVLNCAGTRTFDLTRSPYRKDTGIVGFLMIPAEDYEEFDIMQYFMDAIIFLDRVKATGGRALVHCSIGVNRSGAIVAAYLMIHQRRPLLKVIEDIKSKRSMVLQNEGFRHQLVRFARCRGLLDRPVRPQKYPNFIFPDYKCSSGKPMESGVVFPDQERGETVTNGTSKPELESTSRDTSETVNSEPSNSDHQTSEETSGEQNSCGTEDRKSPLPSNSNGTAGKFSGYENELGGLEDGDERPRRKSPRLEVPSMEGFREELDKTFNKFSFLDLGGSRCPTRTEHSSSNKLASPLSFTDLDSSSTLAGSSSRSPDLGRLQDAGGEKSSSSKLSTSPSPKNVAGDLYPGDNPLDHEEFHRRYASYGKAVSSYDPSSISCLAYDEVTRRCAHGDLQKGHAKVLNAGDRFGFVSSVKPLSYYQRIVALNSSRSYPGTEDDEPTLAGNIRSGVDRSVSKSRPVYESREGTPRVSYMARPTAIQKSSFSKDSLSSRPKNNRVSLANLDFPSRSSDGYHSQYLPQTSNYRSVMEYDDAVDEYSDLLDASIGRSSALCSSATSRFRNGVNEGSGQFHRY